MLASGWRAEDCLDPPWGCSLIPPGEGGSETWWFLQHSLPRSSGCPRAQAASKLLFPGQLDLVLGLVISTPRFMVRSLWDSG